MKIWRTLLFAVVAFSLGLYIWLVEKPRMAAEAEPDKLGHFDPAQVAKLHLEYPQPPALALERTGADWRLTEPLQADADDEAVKRLLEQIAGTAAERRIPKADAEALATYGLEGNGTQARVSMALEDGTPLPDIVVGNTTPVGFQAFVRVEGNDDVVLVPLLLHTGIKKSAFDLREKNLFQAEPTDAIAATITTPKTIIDLARAGDQWDITAPIRDAADRDQIQTLVRSLGEITAQAFYDGTEVDRAKFGLVQPQLSFEVRLGDRGVVGFRLGGKTTDSPPGYYLERIGDGQVASVPEWVRVRFGQDVNSLRDKRMFHCAEADIARVSFERGDGEAFSLLKADDGSWRVEPAQDRPVQAALVERLVGGLASLAGKEIVAESADTPETLARFGLATPAVQVEVSSKDGQTCGRTLAAEVGGDPETPAYYIKRAEDGTVMTVPAYLYSRLNMRAVDFLEPRKESGNDQTPPSSPGKPDQP